MKSLWIDNRFVASNGKPIPVIDPSTEEVIDEVADATREEVGRFIASPS